MPTQARQPRPRPQSGPRLRASVIEATLTAIARARVRRDVCREYHLVVTLHELEPAQPLWAQQLGDVLRKLGRSNEAASAYRHAAELYMAQGSTEHADAMRCAARRAA